ncbi:MAG TPA: GH36 C-terminal domain-containing protein, partial [Bryobacteraceae bacterium]|nr:GH36 C-terminal domain-containing protein [Bryobacteraceae bacterium]
ALLQHTDTTWLSDMVLPRPSLQLAYGCTVEFLPEVCNHWMVGDKEDGTTNPNSPPGWWDFMLRVPMNGQFGISSRVFDWTPAQVERAAANVALYKRLRGVIQNADVYHLTPPPPHNNPAGWMALEYVSPDRRRAVVMAYRLARGAARETLRLRALDPETRYRVSSEGSSIGVFTGRQLISAGLPVALAEEWRALPVELSAETN